MQLARPTHLSERAQRTLQRLAAVGLGKAISVGGALGIQHYLDYRPTHDVDAWWTAAAGPTERAEVCEARLTSPAECWRLWRERQQRAGADAEPYRARIAVETQLARIALHRPLERIADPEERAESERVRGWVEKELLDALVD